MTLSLEILSAETEGAWDDYVAAHEDATCYHHRAWQIAARAAYGVETPSLIARGPSGEIEGLLPLFIVRRLWSSYGVTAVFGGYGRVLASNEEARVRLLDEARRVAEKRHLSYLIHKSVGEGGTEARWDRGDAAVIATLSLRAGEASLWKGFRGEIRNRVRKAEASGLRVVTGEDEFEAFYDVLALNMHRKGTPIYGREFLRGILAAFGPRAYVITVRHGALTVGGALVIEYRGVANVPFVSSAPSAFALAPNNLLYWEIIKRSCARGLHTLDFGRSFRGTSSLEFKRRWGATVVPQPFYFIHRGAPPIIEPVGATVERIVAAWKRVPRAFADGLGPVLAGLFLI
ncbi:MAG: GNAT family N-acetyltransferase [Vicinamibacteria bacterium]